MIKTTLGNIQKAKSAVEKLRAVGCPMRIYYAVEKVFDGVALEVENYRKIEQSLFEKFNGEYIEQNGQILIKFKNHAILNEYNLELAELLNSEVVIYAQPIDRATIEPVIDKAAERFDFNFDEIKAIEFALTPRVEEASQEMANEAVG